MKRGTRVARLWGWLPTFRAVGETEHVSRAAAELGVSASAVSRMLGLLEAELGEPLLRRVGRGVRLTDAGARLLGAVRNAMRLVDEGLAELASGEVAGPVRVASAEPVTRAFLLPALAVLRGRHPRLVPSVRVTREEDVPAMLLGGLLDVAFVRHALPREALSVERLGELPGGVYAGKGHPLFAAKRPSVADALAHAFVVAEAEEAADARWWPVALRRKIALRVEALDMVAELCATGELLAVLPDVVAERHRQAFGAELRRLPFGVVRPIEIFAVWRERLLLPGPAEAVVEAVRARFDARRDR
jgi:DNA-binding transcriptional LysR family regulator